MPKNLEKGKQLIDALRNERTEEALQLIADGADLTYSFGFRKQQALHDAICKSNLKIVDALLKAGAEIDACNMHGETPLHLAAENSEITERLLQAKPNLNIKTYWGHRTALHYAAKDGTPETITLLVNAGIDKEMRNHNNETALHIALFEKDGGANAKKLIELQADVHVKYNTSSTLHLAVKSNHLALIKILVDAGVGVDTPDWDDRSPLHCAVIADHIDAARILIALGASKIAKDSALQTPIDLVIERNNPEMMALFQIPPFWTRLWLNVVAMLMPTPAPDATTPSAITLAQQPPVILSGHAPASQTSAAFVVSDTTENKPLTQPAPTS